MYTKISLTTAQRVADPSITTKKILLCQLLIDDNGSAALPSTGTPSPLPKTPHRHGNTLGRTLLDLAIGSLRAGPSRFVSSPPSVVCGGVDAARRRVRPLRPRRTGRLARVRRHFLDHNGASPPLPPGQPATGCGSGCRPRPPGGFFGRW